MNILDKTYELIINLRKIDEIASTFNEGNNPTPQNWLELSDLHNRIMKLEYPEWEISRLSLKTAVPDDKDRSNLFLMLKTQISSFYKWKEANEDRIKEWEELSYSLNLANEAAFEKFQFSLDISEKEIDQEIEKEKIHHTIARHIGKMIYGGDLHLPEESSEDYRLLNKYLSDYQEAFDTCSNDLLKIYNEYQTKTLVSLEEKRNRKDELQRQFADYRLEFLQKINTDIFSSIDVMISEIREDLERPSDTEKTPVKRGAPKARVFESFQECFSDQETYCKVHKILCKQENLETHHIKGLCDFLISNRYLSPDMKNVRTLAGHILKSYPNILRAKRSVSTITSIRNSDMSYWKELL